ncbi:peptidoglycan editing factor PgeF [Halobacillus sp. K22]|uniref:peptidoglycan editing factor PgeF n=1 Tax=Halobacillus sp. K22 TaxID=3457431 RepID=UPI003FCC5B7C
MHEPFTAKTLQQHSCFTNHEKIIAGLTTRQGGHSERPFNTLNMGLHVQDESDTVLRNREELAQETGFPLKNWIIGEQIHDIRVKVIENGEKGKGVFSHESAVAGVDGLITNHTDVLLGAFYADCVPLFLYAPVSGWIGIAHAGWKGTVRNMVSQMIGKLTAQGCSLDEIELVIGPCISEKNYEVDQRVYDQVPVEFRGEAAVYVSSGKYKLDLKKLNEAMALQSGLNKENVLVSRLCTYEEENLFYSHRRDQGRTGRMLGFIGLKG